MSEMCEIYGNEWRRRCGNCQTAYCGMCQNKNMARFNSMLHCYDCLEDFQDELNSIMKYRK